MTDEATTAGSYRSGAIALILSAGVGLGVVLGVASALMLRPTSSVGVDIRFRIVALSTATGSLPALVLLVAALALLLDPGPEGRVLRLAAGGIVAAGSAIILGTVLDCWSITSEPSLAVIAQPLALALGRAVAVLPAGLAVWLVATRLAAGRPLPPSPDGP